MKSSQKAPKRPKASHESVPCPTCGRPIETFQEIVRRVAIEVLGKRELERIRRAAGGAK